MRAGSLPSLEEVRGWFPNCRDPAFTLGVAIRAAERLTGVRIRPSRLTYKRDLGLGLKVTELYPTRDIRVNGLPHEDPLEPWRGAIGTYEVTLEVGFPQGEVPALLRELVEQLIRSLAGDLEARALTKELALAARSYYASLYNP